MLLLSNVETCPPRFFHKQSMKSNCFLGNEGLPKQTKGNFALFPASCYVPMFFFFVNRGTLLPPNVPLVVAIVKRPLVLGTGSKPLSPFFSEFFNHHLFPSFNIQPSFPLRIADSYPLFLPLCVFLLACISKCNLHF